MKQPTFTVVANAHGRDLGGITRDLEKILTDLRSGLKPGDRIELAGQAALMRSSYSELIGGLGLAAVLVFLVMVVNFQSWTLPFVAISGLPVAISGALFSLWLTGTPLSVPALMGIIMVVGVPTANSVLVTSFARIRFDEGLRAAAAAMEGHDAASARFDDRSRDDSRRDSDGHRAMRKAASRTPRWVAPSSRWPRFRHLCVSFPAAGGLRRRLRSRFHPGKSSAPANTGAVRKPKELVPQIS